MGAYYPDSVERGNGSQFPLREEEEEERRAQKMRGWSPLGSKAEQKERP